jgi:hypothetical protein
MIFSHPTWHNTVRCCPTVKNHLPKACHVGRQKFRNVSFFCRLTWHALGKLFLTVVRHLSVVLCRKWKILFRVKASLKQGLKCLSAMKIFHILQKYILEYIINHHKIVDERACFFMISIHAVLVMPIVQLLPGWPDEFAKRSPNPFFLKVNINFFTVEKSSP